MLDDSDSRTYSFTRCPYFEYMCRSVIRRSSCAEFVTLIIHPLKFLFGVPLRVGTTCDQHSLELVGQILSSFYHTGLVVVKPHDEVAQPDVVHGVKVRAVPTKGYVSTLGGSSPLHSRHDVLRDDRVLLSLPCTVPCDGITLVLPLGLASIEVPHLIASQLAVMGVREHQFHVRHGVHIAFQCLIQYAV